MIASESPDCSACKGSPTLSAAEIRKSLADPIISGPLGLKNSSVRLALFQLIQSKFTSDLINEHVLTINDPDIITDGDFGCPLVCMNPGKIAGQDLVIITASAKEVRRQVRETEEDLLKIQPGWVHFGGKHDVPKNAFYVGRHGDTYAWVLPDDAGRLAEFTLTVINFSGLIKDSSVVTMPGGPRFSPTPSTR